MGTDKLMTLEYMFIIFFMLSIVLILFSLQEYIGVLWQKLFTRLNKNTCYQSEQNKLAVTELGHRVAALNEENNRIKKEYHAKIFEVTTEFREGYEQVEQMALQSIMQQQKELFITSTPQVIYNGFTEKEIIKKIFSRSLPILTANQEKLVEVTIHDFWLVIDKLETRVVLPYLVLLKLFKMYTEEEIVLFKEAFTFFYQYWQTERARRILRNQFLTPKRKLQLIDEDISIRRKDENFYEFLLYMLTKYKQKEYKIIYENFLKAYNTIYGHGDLYVIVADEKTKQIFLNKWLARGYNFNLRIQIDQSLLCGITMKYLNEEVNYTMQEILIKESERGA